MRWRVGDAAQGGDMSSLYVLGMCQPGLTSPETRTMTQDCNTSNVWWILTRWSRTSRSSDTRSGARYLADRVIYADRMISWDLDIGGRPGADSEVCSDRRTGLVSNVNQSMHDHSLRAVLLGIQCLQHGLRRHPEGVP
jgi:hypothetical protein